jgi:Domain of unknown function (DUF5615)
MLPAYADENVKSAVVHGLRQRGMDIVTAQERGQRQTDDETLLATATSEDRLLLTSAVYRRVAHRKMALSEAAIPCLRWRFRLVKAGGYKPEALAKAISEAPRHPDNPSATPL